MTNEDFCRKVIPFLKSEYFHDKCEKLIFQDIEDFFMKYNTVPSKEAVIISLDKLYSALSDNIDKFNKQTMSIFNITPLHI